MTQIFYQNSIAALWLAWLVYWAIAAIGAKVTRRRESVASRLLHLVPLVLGIILLGSPNLGRGWLDVRLLPHSLTWFWVGFSLVGAGLSFTVVARVWLGANWSGVISLKQDHELIQSGPYRWVRHPIYTGLLLAILGTAIARGEVRGMLALALVTASFLRKITIEERFLTEQFGETYVRYRAEMPALIPFWR